MYCTRCGTPARILRFCTKCGRDLRKYQNQFDACRSAAAHGRRMSSVDPNATTDREMATGRLNAIATDRTRSVMVVVTQPNLSKVRTLPLQAVITRQERQKTITRTPLTVGLLLLALSALSFGLMRWQQKQGLPVVRAFEVQKASPVIMQNANPEGALDASGETLPLAKALSSMADAIGPAPSAPGEAPMPQIAPTRPTLKKTVARLATRKTVASRPAAKLAEKRAEAQGKNADRDKDSKKQKASKEKERNKHSTERAERYAIRNAYRYGSAFEGTMRFDSLMRSECRHRR